MEFDGRVIGVRIHGVNSNPEANSIISSIMAHSHSQFDGCEASHGLPGGPTCCCASYLLPLEFPKSWPGDALLRLTGGDGDATTAKKSATKAVTIVHGLKKIITVSDKGPTDATAMAISEAGTILDLGSDAEMVAKYGSEAGVSKVELKGKTLIPGYIDVHVGFKLVLRSNEADQPSCLPGRDFEQTHPTMFSVGESVVHNVSMFKCKTKKEVLAKIKAVHEQTPGDGVIAFQGFNHSALPEREFVNRNELDAISKDRPIIVTHNTGQ
jgi:hypothetical protein